MQAVDLTSGKELAGNLEVACTLGARMQGLLGRHTLPPGAGLWIRPCLSIHTFGMRFPIDALFLDKNQRVVGLAQALAPNQVCIHCRARSVMEFPAGTLELSGTLTGNHIAVLSHAARR